MSIRHSLLTLCGVSLMSMACQSTPPPPEGGHQDHLVLLEVPTDPTISFSLQFGAGSLHDPAGKEGLAYLTGALIAQGGTTENTFQDILGKLYPLASSYNIRVDKEMTTLSGRTHKDNLDTYFKLLSDAYLRPAFDENDFNRLKDDQLNTIRKALRYSSDEELGKAALYQLLFEGNGYRHPPIGTVAALEAITLDDVRQFYATHYTAENAVLGLGGGYPQELVELFASTLDQLPQEDSATAAAPQAQLLTGRKVLLVQKDDADASISFGFPIDVKRGERDFYALWLANSWLGEHRNSASHLYKVIREKRGLNYGDYSYIETFPEGGFRQMPPTGISRSQQIFEIWIRTLPNENALFALRAALRELQNLVDNGMSPEDFALTQEFLSKYYLHFAETTQGRLGYALADRFYGIDAPGHLARFPEMIQSLTREEVNAALKKHLRYENLGIAMVTGQAEQIKEALIADTPSPPQYAVPKGEEILTEDAEILSFPLSIPEGAVAIMPVDEVFER